MVGVCFFFEDAYVDVFSGTQDSLDAWNYAIKSAGDVDKIVIVNSSSFVPGVDSDLPTTVVETLPDLPNAVHVCCPWDSAKSKTSLWDFDHNVEWYIFGPASGWKAEVERGVFIPIAGRGALHSTHIASAVMLHRFHIVGSSKGGETWQ